MLIISFKTKKEYESALKEWQKKHDEVVSLGGLHVIGTERHESRRIDNQLSFFQTKCWNNSNIPGFRIQNLIYLFIKCIQRIKRLLN